MESLKLSSYAFQYKLPEDKQEERLKKLSKHEIYGVFDQNVLASKLHILPFYIWLNQQKVKMGGIAGVSTYPEYRRKGYVAELIKHSLSEMKENAQIVSILHPFSVEFYRKYGWEVLSNYIIVHLSREDLKMKSFVEGQIKRFTKETFPNDMNEIYNTYAAKFAGLLDRDGEWWKENVIGDATVAIYCDHLEQPKGYMIYEIANSIMKIKEFIATTHEARLGLWNYICQHDSMLHEVEMYLEERDPLLLTVLNPKGKMNKRAFGMIRIVNVLSFLQVYPFNYGESGVVLQVFDEHAHWNNGKFTISSESIIQNNTEAREGIQVSINHLSALLFGSISVQELVEMDALQGNEQEIREFESLIPKKRPFLTDFF